MKYTEEEKQLLNENPDFESQIQILEEEHKENLKKRKFVKIASGILILVATIFYVAYATVYVYRPYGQISSDLCEMVNIKINDSPIPNLNVTEGDNCKPIYNVDYSLNGRPTFNIDLFGDKTVIFNKINQKDPTGSYCVMNCDANDDGWPDYNIDLNGDGKADINIILDPQKKKTGCDLNCDINKDTLPDTDIDTNGDNKPDVNITDGKDNTKPKYNIDYMGNNKPTFNILEDGKVKNPVNDASNGKQCSINCDLNNDGWPDYNIDLNGDGKVDVNELIKKGNEDSSNTNSKNKDWKCFISRNLDGCNNNSPTNNNTYINIDVNGDGKPDVNISNDGGKTITNPVNKNENGTVLNKDTNNDGFPDLNIDVNNDGKPDLNITEKNKDVCVKNCDTNFDGIPDYLTVINKDTNEKYSILNINVDKDYDGKCDVNCDIDGDLYPDINIDVDGDLIPDINIDHNHDNVPDYNIDTNGDGKPNKNIDAYYIGACNFNCDGKNQVNTGNSCTKNCDTDKDGKPDKNVDIDNDGVCDFNCGNDNNTKDNNHDYYLDHQQDHDLLLDVTHNGKNSIYVTNPIDIKALDIEPGWSGTYVITIKNTSYYAVKYRIYWTKVTNNFTNTNNLDYQITRDGATYVPLTKAPYSNVLVKDELLLKSQASMKYVMKVDFKETGVSQNVDAGKTFYGQLRVEVIK